MLHELWEDPTPTDGGYLLFCLAGPRSAEARAMLVRTVPRGSLITPEEVAAAVAWLCAPEASAVTGVALPIAGGEL